VVVKVPRLIPRSLREFTKPRYESKAEMLKCVVVY